MSDFPIRFASLFKGRDRSIARRLAVSLIVTVSIVSLITVGFIYFKETQKAKLELEQKADDIIAYQVGVLEIPLWDLDNRAIRVVGKLISQNDVVAELVIKDYFGREVYAHKNDNLLGSVIRSARIMHNDNFVGDVFLSLTKQYYQEGNRNLLFSFALIVVLILFSLIFVSGFLVRTFLRKPLGKLNTIIESYAAGEYDSFDHYQPYIEFKPFSRVLQQMGDKITEHLKALARAEEKYRSIFENAIEGIFQSSPDGHFINVNPAMAEILGYDSPEDLLTSVRDIATQFYVEPEDRQRFRRLMDRDNRVLEFETQLYRKDGMIITASESARTVRDAGGAVLYYEGYLVDITQRKKAAEALHQTKEQLALLLESLPIVPFTCKAGGDFGITYVSKTIEELTGYKPSDFIRDSSFWARHVSEEDCGRILGELPAVLKNERYHAEYRFRASDGSYRWFEDTRRLVRTASRGISHIAGTWRDVTEEKRLRKEADYRLQQMIQTDKMASLGKVVSGVAHEINNPNSFISYNVPLLEETWQILAPILMTYSEQNPHWRYRSMTMGELCDDMVEIIRSIKTGSDRINRIVTDLKDFVRLDEGLPLTPVNVNQVIEKAYTIFGAQVRKTVAKVHTALCPDLPVIQGNFQKLEQVVTNLVVNSLHAITDKNKGKLSITTGYLPDHAAVVIQVEDNGTGMAPDILNRIFEPFFTLRRESGGTGIGLSVSYGLVKEHNGILGVLSRPGKGSRFSVFLPTDPGVKLELRPAVLCVDRDEAFARVLTSHLAESRESLLFTLDCPEKVTALVAQKPEIDIILANLEILCRRGWQVLTEIKERFPLIAVILYSDDPDALEQKPDGEPLPDFLLPKPFQIEALKEIIATIGRQRL
ncbi:MAG: PAS domain S-box protein [Desulfobacteraceae bacterium]|jgi:PAS domain S-box-containing protein|nr:PAS domain S-box protein [Desulfobacteraceae bacterium]